jgi:Flp pilus assembly protein TadG
MSKTRGRRIGRDRQDGAVAVEFALVASFVLLPILAGVIQFGISFSQLQVYQGAAREGARCAAVQAAEAAAGLPVCSITGAIADHLGTYDPPTDVTITVGGVSSPSGCTAEDIGKEVTVGWDQAFDLTLTKFLPVPDTVHSAIDGTFRCE